MTDPTPDIVIVSAGALHGTPPTGHITLDLRDHFCDVYTTTGGLCDLTADDQMVRDAVLATPGIDALIDATAAGARAYLDAHATGTGSLLIVATCASGRRRSPTVAAVLAERLRAADITTRLAHRDMHRPVLARPAPTPVITCPAPGCGSTATWLHDLPVPGTDDHMDAVDCLICDLAWVLDPAADISCTVCGGSGHPGVTSPRTCACAAREAHEFKAGDTVTIAPLCCEGPMGFQENEPHTWSCLECYCAVVVDDEDDDTVVEVVTCHLH